MPVKKDTHDSSLARWIVILKVVYAREVHAILHKSLLHSAPAQDQHVL